MTGMQAAIAFFLSITVVGIAQGAKSDKGEAVDIFPAQSWAALNAGAAVPEEAPPPPPVIEPPPEPEPIAPPVKKEAPFQVIGQWQEENRRIYILEGMGRIFLLCGKDCHLPDVISPGKEIVAGYRLRKLRQSSVVIIDAEKNEYELPVPVSVSDS